MSTQVEVPGIVVWGRPRIDAAVGVWLVVSFAATIVGWLEQWPAQFGGAGTPGHVGSELFGKGTALSPPLFMIILMLLGIGLTHLSQRPARWAGLSLCAVVALIGVVGSLGEVLASATPDLPRAVQWLGLVGVVLSLGVLVAAGLDLRPGPRGR